MHSRSRTRWLAEASFEAGLLVPGKPRGGAADLRLTIGNAELAGGDCSVRLEWADLDSALRSSSDGPGTWSIAPWSFGRSGPIGIAVAVSGGYVDSTARLRGATRSWRNRINRFLQRGVVVPLYGVSRISRAVDADRDLIEVICTLAADRQEAREHLGDSARVERLLSDVRANRFEIPPFRAGGRRATVEVLTAMRAAGFEHKFYGRPMPDEDLPGEDDVIAKVFDRVRANPHALGVDIDEATVRSVVERHYLKVEPWPLRALLDL